MAKARLEAMIGLNGKAFRKGLLKIKASVVAFKKNIARAGKAIFAGLTVAAVAFGVALKRVTDRGDYFGKLAKRTGFATDELQRLSHAAEISGTNMESIAKAIKRFPRVLRDARRGLSTAVDALDELGLSAKDFEGLSPEKAFRKLMLAVSEIKDPMQKAALAQEVFGRAGTELIPLLNEGAKGIKNLSDEADKLGLVMSAEQIRNAETFKDEITRVKAQVTGIVQKWVGGLLPAINKAVTRIGEMLTSFRNSGKMQEFADKLFDAATSLTAAVEAFSSVDNKFKSFFDIMVSAFSAGGEIIALKIKEAMGDNAFGRMASRIKDVSAVLGVISAGGDWMDVAISRMPRGEKQIKDDFLKTINDILPDMNKTKDRHTAFVNDLFSSEDNPFAVGSDLYNDMQADKSTDNDDIADIRKELADIFAGLPDIEKDQAQKRTARGSLSNLSALGRSFAGAGQASIPKQQLTVQEKFLAATKEIREINKKQLDKMGKGGTF